MPASRSNRRITVSVTPELHEELTILAWFRAHGTLQQEVVEALVRHVTSPQSRRQIRQYRDLHDPEVPDAVIAQRERASLVP